LRHEPTIDEKWCEKYGVTTTPVGVVAHIENRHYRASLDRLVDLCPDGEGPCGLQIKTRSAFKAGEWKTDVPDDTYFQEQWEMVVTGYRHMHVAALIGGNHMEYMRVDYDAHDASLIIERAEHVWGCVQSGDIPTEVRRTEMLSKSLNRLFPNREGQAVLEPLQADALMANWRDAKTAEQEANRAAKRAKEERLAAEAAMTEALGDKQAAYVGDLVAYASIKKERGGYEVKPTHWFEIKVNPEYTLQGAPS
jgi:predicted phage-related endonuclease